MNLPSLRTTAALLVTSALLSACVSQKTYDQQVAKTSTYQQLDAQLKSEISADQAQITQLQNVVQVTLANGILFPEGGWELNPAGKATLSKLAPVLKTLTGQKIEVKGFTDNVPIGPELRARFPSNLELSKARAQSVADHLVAQGVPPGILSVSGFGDAQPVASNDTAQGRAKNRRVVMDIIEAK
ncbi:MAG TPA: OmpA family protein [Rubrivivax sp.]|nr:OmpA family protein [Rubrivivax sp.]